MDCRVGAQKRIYTVDLPVAGPSPEPFGQRILGLEDVPGQMNLYLEWHGTYAAYGIVGGPP